MERSYFRDHSVVACLGVIVKDSTIEAKKAERVHCDNFDRYEALVPNHLHDEVHIPFHNNNNA
eukprot:3818583-Ditylum_brightwellii.AAC.1